MLADAYVAIGVTDLAASRRMWEAGLGLPVVGEWEAQVALARGPLEVLLDSTGDVPVAGGVEIGLRVSLDELTEALARLERLGIRPFRGPGDFGGPLGFEAAVRDADGHVVCLYCPASLAVASGAG
jgi:catechol 2,3-dioxygenase-like lactoylglutathione lyase family enzyme